MSQENVFNEGNVANVLHCLGALFMNTQRNFWKWPASMVHWKESVLDVVEAAQLIQTNHKLGIRWQHSAHSQSWVCFYWHSSNSVAFQNMKWLQTCVALDVTHWPITDRDVLGIVRPNTLLWTCNCFKVNLRAKNMRRAAGRRRHQCTPSSNAALWHTGHYCVWFCITCCNLHWN